MGYTCRDCKKKERLDIPERIMLSVRGYGQGSYKRAPRRYDTTICVGCAREMVANDDKRVAEGCSNGVYSNGFVISSVRFALKRYDEELKYSLADLMAVKQSP